VKHVKRLLLEQLLAQPAPIRLLVGALAIGVGVVVWRLAPQMVSSGAEPSRDVRPEASPASTVLTLVRSSYRVGVRLQAVAMIVLGAILAGAALVGD
jgi:hypothetical protein